MLCIEPPPARRKARGPPSSNLPIAIGTGQALSRVRGCPFLKKLNSTTTEFSPYYGEMSRVDEQSESGGELKKGVNTNKKAPRFTLGAFHHTF